MKVRVAQGLCPAIAVAVLMGAALWSAPAQAGSRPAEACRPLASVPGPHGLWLGHFTGGRRIGPGVEWRDDYACFTTSGACRAWWASLRREYRDVQGHGTCMALRGGGREIRVARTVLRTRY
ncbi:MAG TPA: hypothetical protein VIL72_11590 [Beijerinckiaceae bacterium]|jgi:hypothetical protein